MTTATLTALDARRLTSEIRNALAVADGLLARAYAGEVWTALGHADWAAYCAAELPELQHIKLRAPARRERTKLLVEQGATEREIAAATGASPATAHRDVLAVTGRSASNEADAPGRGAVEAPPTSAASPAAPQLSGAARVRAALADAGTAGVTTPELVERLALHHGVVSGELSRCAKHGRALQPTITRDGYGVYVRA